MYLLSVKEKMTQEIQELHAKRKKMMCRLYLRNYRHSEYDNPKLRLWARMLASNIHDDYDILPAIPAFSAPAPKKPCKENMCEAMTGAAVAFVNAMRSRDKDSPTTTVAGISPKKSVELRMKNYEQLKVI